MRYNEKEIADFSAGPGDKEGRLYYKSPGGFREASKERWFKLKGNLLFYFRLNQYGAVYEKEPVGLLVIEHCRIQHELYAEFPNTFSITYSNDLEKRHLFGCETQKQTEDWVKCLKVCSYEQQRIKLKELQEKLLEHTGRDPLSSLSTSKKVEMDRSDADSYFDNVHFFSKSNGEFVSLI